MTLTTRHLSLSLIALAAALSLTACNRGSDTTASKDATGSTTASTTPTDSSSTSTAPSTAATPAPSSDMSGAAATSGTGLRTSSSGTGSATPLAAADSQFVTKAAEGGQFEVEIGKLAADKATDPNVKAFAQMLVDDHTAANDRLRQIASGHNLALPASLPDDMKKEIDQLSKLSGAKFDKQFVKMVGIKDHHHDIAEFEKASRSAQSADVKDFAASTLPTLKKHLDAAEKLPAKG